MLVVMLPKVAQGCNNLCELAYLDKLASLVSRPSPPSSSFDQVRYAKWRGKAWEILSHE